MDLAFACCLGLKRLRLTRYLVVSLFVVSGCGSAAGRVENPTRPLDERRAIEIIRRAMREEGADPSNPREIKLVGGEPMVMDVSTAGKKFGVAYVTTADALQLGDAIPPRNQRDERLRLVRAGDGTVWVVLLYQDNYVYDDLAGESHAQTAISAERQLARDVRDFITHARSKNYE